MYVNIFFSWQNYRECNGLSRFRKQRAVLTKRIEQYLRNASDAERRAAQSSGDLHTVWITIASSWHALVRELQHSAHNGEAGADAKDVVNHAEQSQLLQLLLIAPFVGHR